LIVSEHIDITMAAHNGENLAQRLIPWGTQLFYPQVDRIIAVSNGVKESLIQTGNVPESLIQTIYNPVITPAVLQQMEVPANHPWFEQSHIPVIISAGRLTKQKDHATLLQAFATLRKQMPAKLLILGDGEERPILERLAQKLNIQDHISLPGFVENPFSYMKRADVFVLSSRWEGFGNVLVEAMACQTPVVSTDCPSGPSEILENGKYGSLTPVGNADMLANAMLEMLNRPFPVARLLYERAMEFSIETIIPQYFDALQSNLSRSKAG
jgi:glycosyltransferase involved in cell wall biosynthesis